MVAYSYTLTYSKGYTMKFKTFAWITLLMLLCSVQSFAQETLQELAMTLSKQFHKQKIAVVNFSCINTHSLTASSIIQERLTTFMGSDKSLTVVERSKLDTILKEQELQLSGAVDADTAQIAGKLLAVDVIITGTILYLTNNEIEVYARALDVRSGKILTTTKAIIKKDWQDNEILNTIETPTTIPQIAAEHFKAGSDYYSQGKYSIAIEFFNRVIAHSPDFANAYLYRGISYYKKGKYDYALMDLNKAIEINPELAQAYYQRAIFYKFVKVEYESAIEDFDKAIELNPNISSYYTERGELYIFIKEYDKALADFNKAIMLDSNAADAYAWRGYIYSIKGDNNKAIKDFSKAIEISPQSIGYWIDRATVYYDIGDYKKAINDCNKAIEIDPEHASEAFVLRDSIYKTINKKH